ncbi:response regulator transcription factor [Arcanobacterium haemolyticum]|nr:response regulator transcription factor [Arcanobacterium haemolyticum]
MPHLVVLTSEAGDPALVLPGIALLTYTLDAAPLTTSALAANLNADALILDGRRDLVSARALCRAATETMDAPPILLVLEEGGYAVVGASWGASDTILFSAPPAEIQARIRMMCDRAQAEHARDTDPQHLTDASPAIVVNPGAYTATVNGKPLDLTYKEFELLHYLVERPGQVISRDELLQKVWGYNYYGGSRTVDVHVRRLRAKLGSELESTIVTVRNVGYRFDPSRS